MTERHINERTSKRPGRHLDNPVSILPCLEDDGADDQPLVVGQDGGGQPRLRGEGGTDALRAGEALRGGWLHHGYAGMLGRRKSPERERATVRRPKGKRAAPGPLLLIRNLPYMKGKRCRYSSGLVKDKS